MRRSTARIENTCKGCGGTYSQRCREVVIISRDPDAGDTSDDTTVTVVFNRNPVRICNVAMWGATDGPLTITWVYDSTTHTLTVTFDPRELSGNQELTILIDVDCRTRCRRKFHWSWNYTAQV